MVRVTLQAVRAIQMKLNELAGAKDNSGNDKEDRL